MRRAIVLFLDGLRRDMLAPQWTPRLVAHARDVESFAEHRSVLPSATRVVSSSVATGCWPARHEMQGNSLVLIEDGRLVGINSAGGNVTDGLAFHDAIRQIVNRGIEVTIVVQGMAYSMGSVVLQAASNGRRLALPHSWIMIHEPAKWAGWQSTSAAAQHLDRLKQMQRQIYEILSNRSGRPLQKIIRDTKRTDFYLDAKMALEYGLIDAIIDG